MTIILIRISKRESFAFEKNYHSHLQMRITIICIYKQELFSNSFQMKPSIDPSKIQESISTEQSIPFYQKLINPVLYSFTCTTYVTQGVGVLQLKSVLTTGTTPSNTSTVITLTRRLLCSIHQCSRHMESNIPLRYHSVSTTISNICVQSSHHCQPTNAGSGKVSAHRFVWVYYASTAIVRQVFFIFLFTTKIISVLHHISQYSSTEHYVRGSSRSQLKSGRYSKIFRIGFQDGVLTKIYLKGDRYF